MTAPPLVGCVVWSLSNKVIKHIQGIIAEPLTIIINQMLNTGIFPDSLKISKV